MRHVSLSMTAFGLMLTAPLAGTAADLPARFSIHQHTIAANAVAVDQRKASPTVNRLQPALVCLDPGVEFLVACDEDDD